MARTPKVSDQEILHCLADGMRQNEIAERYGVHPTSISQRVKAMRKTGMLPSSGESSTPPESKTGECVVFNLMDTVIRKKDRQWFRIIGHEDVFYELRPLDQGKTAGSQNDIDVHVRDLHKNYIKKDYPAVKVYNLADQEEKKEDKPMNYNEAVEKLKGVQVGATTQSVPAVEVIPEPEDEPEEVAFGQYHAVTTGYSVKREFLYRIDCILDAVGIGASESIMEHTGRLIAQIIEEGMKEEI